MSEPKSALEWYIAIRGSTILGDHASADALYRQFPDDLKLSFPYLNQLIYALLGIITRRDIDGSIEALIELGSHLHGMGYLLGETHFLIGLGHNFSDHFGQGLPHFRLASRYYSENGFSTLATIAQFNVCVSLNHLGRLSELVDQERALHEKAKAAQTKVATLHAKRFQLYRCVDLQQFSAALIHCDDLLDQAISMERWRDTGEILALYGYIAIKANRAERLIELVARLRSNWHLLPEAERQVFGEFLGLSQSGLTGGDDAKKFARRWRLAEIDSVHRFHLVDCLLDTLALSGQWQVIATLAERACAESLQHQQAFHLVDFNFHRIRAVIMLEDKDRAKAMIESYRRIMLGSVMGSVSSHAHQHILEKIGQLELLILGLEDSKVKGGQCEDKKLKVVFDSDEMTVAIGAETINLKFHPTILRALSVLAATPRGLEMDEFFEAIYDLPYNPLRHERRVAGLLERIRKVTGKQEIVVRLQGKIATGLPITSKSASEGRSGRQKKIVEKLRFADHPLSMSEIISDFNVSRRMLQLDLKHLIAAGQIQAGGVTRTRIYSINEIGRTL